MSDRSLVLDALEYLDPAPLDYKDWELVGMALHKEGYPATVWDEWSRRDTARYHEGECFSKWSTFGNYQGREVTGGTIVKMARDNGFNGAAYTDDVALEWDETIIDQGWVEPVEVEAPNDWNPIDDLVTYISTLYEGDECIGYVLKACKDEDGKWKPGDKGIYGFTARKLINSLRHSSTVDEALGTINRESGAWIRFNPLDGKGAKDANVTDYRYALVESDELPPEKQRAIIEALRLPCAAIVYSGGKSIHAIVRVEASDYTQYKDRVERLYKICDQNGLKVDRANKNPSRLSRMPGVERGDQKQYLIGTNVGCESWAQWIEWIEEESDDLPDAENLASVWDALPPLAPPLIDGVLRQGHKMLLAGPSKAGKSFALIELCIAIAEGRSWLGFACTQGRVMYVNLELDRASCLNRFKDVYQALGIEPANLKNIDVWNLRGKSKPMDKLTPALIRRALKTRPIAVIIDPIYKVITGDENSADQMARFCNQFDLVATEVGCSVIYCHHHSKGAQGGKRSMDRASGSGVFARDPDAQLDMIQLIVPENLSNERGNDGETAWRVEGILREFPSFEPINLWFSHPLHTLDDTGALNALKPELPMWQRGVEGKKKSDQAKKSTKRDEYVEAIRLAAAGDAPTYQEIADYFGDGRKAEAVRKDIKSLGFATEYIDPMAAKNRGLSDQCKVVLLP